MPNAGADPNELSGTRLGRYTLVRLLGAGGMAELFLARADGLAGFSKLVAIKRILPHKAKNERFVRMLLNEARLVASLDHPNIAHVYDVDFDQGQYFFAMEYVHGQDLRHITHTAPNRRLQLENVLHIAIGICAGLHHAHEARDAPGASLAIVHRDVSPSNVLVSYEGAVKLVDFGVAKAASVVSDTREGIIKGKYGYMSPEQCLGEPLDRRSDLFSVGILLWELTTGRRLYKINGELATLQRVVYIDAPRPSRYAADIPPELERIIMRALARDPKSRYATAQQIQLELETFAVEHKLPVSPVSMSLEMKQLFKERINAWREAEAAGRSLADHLAEVSSEDAIDSEEAAGIDDMLADMDTSLFAPDPSAAPTALEKRSPVTMSHASTPRLSPSPDIKAVVSPRARARWRAIVGATIVVWAVVAALYVFAIRPRGQAVARQVSADAAATPAPALVVANVMADATLPTTAITEPDPVEPAPVEPDPEVKPVDRDGASKRRPTKPSAKAAHHRADPVPDREPDPAPPNKPAEPAPRPTAPDAGVATVTPPKGPPPGTVDATAVRAVVRAHLGAIQECVSRARMDNRDLKGRIVLRIELAPTGRVTRTSIASSTGATAGLEACMVKAVAEWTFPAPAGGIKAAISYPFAF